MKVFDTSVYYEEHEARAHLFEYFNMCFPVIRTRDNNIAFFNFGADENWKLAKFKL